MGWVFVPNKRKLNDLDRLPVFITLDGLVHLLALASTRFRLRLRILLLVRSLHTNPLVQIKVSTSSYETCACSAPRESPSS